MVDYLEKFKIKVFGPNKNASQLEGSKIFTKKLCKKFHIPTAKFGIFENKEEANKFILSSNFPIVIKADNLAAGKVFISAIMKLKEILLSKKFLMENLVMQKIYYRRIFRRRRNELLYNSWWKNI